MIKGNKQQVLKSEKNAMYFFTQQLHELWKVNPLYIFLPKGHKYFSWSSMVAFLLKLRERDEEEETENATHGIHNVISSII